jgi:hypothetical protein
MIAALFSPGRVVATPGALTTLAAAGIDPLDLLVRHVAGDWDNIPPEDAAENQFSLEHGFRIISAYPGNGERVWLITEADRSITTRLLPSEY